MNVSRLSWNLAIPGYDQKPIPLTREVVHAQVQSAGDLCVSGLVKHFDLNNTTRDGINRAFESSTAWLTEGGEGNGKMKEEGLPIGDVASNVIDFATRRRIETGNVPEQTTPDVYISIDGIAEELFNLQTVARMFEDKERAQTLCDPTIEILAALRDHEEIAINAAVRIATARRMMKYVILPDGKVPERLRGKIGFDLWFSEQIVRRVAHSDVTSKLRKASQKTYIDKHFAEANLRRTVWAPIFFENLGISQHEMAFYLEYRQQIASNGKHTVAFGNPLTIFLSPEETQEALVTIFGSKPKSSPPPKTTKSSPRAA